MNKPKNLLSHALFKEDYGNNLVDFMIGYLLEKGDYNPRAEKTLKFLKFVSDKYAF